MFLIDETVGINLRTIRIERKLTQEQLALKAGLSKMTVSNIEMGKGASSKTVTKISDCLGVSPLSFYQEASDNRDILFKRVKSGDANSAYSDKTDTTMLNLLNIYFKPKYKQDFFIENVFPTVDKYFFNNKEALMDRLGAFNDEENNEVLEIFEKKMLESIAKSLSEELPQNEEVHKLLNMV